MPQNSKGLDNSGKRQNAGQPNALHWSMHPLRLSVIVGLAYAAIPVVIYCATVLLSAAWPGEGSEAVMTGVVLIGSAVNVLALALYVLFGLFVLNHQTRQGLAGRSAWKADTGLWVGLGLVCLYITLSLLPNAIRQEQQPGYFVMMAMNSFVQLLLPVYMMLAVSVLYPVLQKAHGYVCGAACMILLYGALQGFSTIFDVFRALLSGTLINGWSMLYDFLAGVTGKAAYCSLAAVVLQAAGRKIPGAMALQAGATGLWLLLLVALRLPARDATAWLNFVCVTLPVNLVITAGCFTILSYFDRGGEWSRLPGSLAAWALKLRHRGTNG